MKRLFDLLINNRYVFIGFTLILLVLKFLLEDYAPPARYRPILDILKELFVIILLLSLAYVFIFFIYAMLAKEKSGDWWEQKELNKKETRRGKWLKIYIHGLIFFIPLTIYGTLIYLALFQPWISLLIFAILFAINRILRQVWQRTKVGEK